MIINKKKIMKKYLLFITTIFYAGVASAQSDSKYPEPEFANEVYYLKKDKVFTAVRLEKSNSKLETTTKAGGLGGFENGYKIEGGKSRVRLSQSNNLSFVISNGASVKKISKSDSMMNANGIDMSAMQDMMGSMNDPASTITLFKVESVQGKRKILLQKGGGAIPFASKKTKSSDKYTFSVKKIREGYWELLIDKPLPRGEYAFQKMETGMGGMDGSSLIFAFGID